MSHPYMCRLRMHIANQDREIVVVSVGQTLSDDFLEALQLKVHPQQTFPFTLWFGVHLGMGWSISGCPFKISR